MLSEVGLDQYEAPGSNGRVYRLVDLLEWLLLPYVVACIVNQAEMGPVGPNRSNAGLERSFCTLPRVGIDQCGPSRFNGALRIAVGSLEDLRMG